MKMQKLYKFILMLLTIIFLFCSLSVSVMAYNNDDYSGKSYTYDDNAKSVSVPNSYEYSETYLLTDDAGFEAKNASDMFVSEKHYIYVADTENSRILIYDNNFKFINSISKIVDNNGNESYLNQPQGIYVYPDETLLIADTANNRIVKCNQNGNASLIIEKIEGMTGVEETTNFNPLKLSVDSVGRIYVVAKDINYGFVQLDADGEFLGYVGAPRVQTDFFTLFWRKISTKKQLAQMTQFVSTEYNNICIDENDFIYGTISSLSTEAIKSAINSRDLSGTVSPIKKLNSLGNDILVRNGQYAPLGDLDFEKNPSRIVDVALGTGGIYSMLDQTNGHIFTYDSQGNLLYAFGGKGYQKSNVQHPVAITYIKDDILVLDSSMNAILQFTPTDYGRLVLAAVSATYDGNYEEAYKLWSDIADKNSNFKYAFEGLGNTKLNEGDYKDAMSCFKYADNENGYSEAFAVLRKQYIQKVFPTVFVLVSVVIGIVLLYMIIRKVYRYGKGYYD